MKDIKIKPIMPNNMKWYRWMRITYIIGAIVNIGYAIAYLQTASLYYILLSILNIGYAAAEIWLFGNMMFLTRKVYKVLNMFLWIHFIFEALSIIMNFAVLSPEEAVTESVSIVASIILTIINIIYIRKRKQYFIYGDSKTTLDVENVDEVLTDEQNESDDLINSNTIIEDVCSNYVAETRENFNTINNNCKNNDEKTSNFRNKPKSINIKHIFLGIIALCVIIMTICVVINTSTQKSHSSSSIYYYIGNSNSMKYHKKSCGHLPAESNRIMYATKQDAIDDGMVPCQICQP